MRAPIVRLKGSSRYWVSAKGYVSYTFSGSSGIVANLFKTCFRAGRRIGLLFPLVKSFRRDEVDIPDEHVHARVHAVFNITFFRESAERNNRRRVAHAPDEAGAL